MLHSRVRGGKSSRVSNIDASLEDARKGDLSDIFLLFLEEGGAGGVAECLREAFFWIGVDGRCAISEGGPRFVETGCS
jgi:hypothetical protein